ncbi:MAG TPA: DUF1699 family protein [Thermococcaceae archaeon]|uniref:DNA-binding protein, containing HTH domain of resolvase n=1 Tax=Thermococcus sibiricus TaxID=172049 RepID=A0A101EMK6_9EURY|nr:DUF1699 family protein [Thermococcus sibiricus]KUK18134.1 MAG: DNA-binding protein, containing HTH domain of resolvase [Thermococcus sibiricus]KUK29039.1 MAG: DNA-binding protein, containing HTH domain of resolvase [Thermococcus sp. 40_45]HII68135.1 DUF1699 family protein [Thermococcaceae archaeon]
MKVEIKARNNEELLKKIDERLDGEVTEVYINLRPTKIILVKILERAPNVKIIECPSSLYPKVSKKIIRALSQMGIKLVPANHSRGRPKKYDGAIIKQIKELVREGKTPKEVSQELNIPLRTVYYIINGR